MKSAYRLILFIGTAISFGIYAQENTFTAEELAAIEILCKKCKQDNIYACQKLRLMLAQKLDLLSRMAYVEKNRRHIIELLESQVPQDSGFVGKQHEDDYDWGPFEKYYKGDDGPDDYG